MRAQRKQKGMQMFTAVTQARAADSVMALLEAEMLYLGANDNLFADCHNVVLETLSDTSDIDTEQLLDDLIDTILDAMHTSEYDTHVKAASVVVGNAVTRLLAGYRERE